MRKRLSLERKAMSKHSAEFSEKLDGVEVFSSGTYQIDEDTTVTYTDQDIKDIAENTNRLISEGKHEPPGKLGHDGAQAFAAASGLPAIGWVSSLKAVGSKLIANFTDVPNLAYKALKAKLYKKISSEIYHEKASKREFGVEGKVLRAVAFLGADVPKVKGLAAFLSELPKDVASRDVDILVYKEEPMAKGDDTGQPLMVPANRHPYGALVTGADGGKSGVEPGKKYKIHNVHMDGTYDVHEDSEDGAGKDHKRVPHHELALMAESVAKLDGKQPAKEGGMPEPSKVELAEKEKNDAIQLAEKSKREAESAKAESARLRSEAQDRVITEFCETHKAVLIPALQPMFKALAKMEVGAVKFGEKDEKPYLETLTAFLSELIKAKPVIPGELSPASTEGDDMNADEVKLAEEPFQVHLDEAKRNIDKPVIVHGELTVKAEEYAEKHPGVTFSQALKHVAKLDAIKPSITAGGKQ